MASSFWNGAPWPDWEKYREWLAKQFPWDIETPWEKLQDPQWLEKYLSRILRDSGFMRRKEDFRTSSMSSSVTIKRHPTYLTVTIRLPPNTDLRHLRLYAAADRLRLTGLPGATGRLVRLPCPVVPRSGRAVMRSGRLVVRLRRRPAPKEEVELFIRE
jgi:hypothetical protein